MPGAISRRSALALLATSGAAALLGACTLPIPQAAPAQTTQSAAGQPKPGGTLKIGVLGDIQGLDGHLVTGLDYLRRVWDVVSVLDDKLNTVPVLAESVELTPDARQMTLKLRKGVRF